jgi:hypothetical protein
MPDGNITQYVQLNPGADRLMLVCAHQLELDEDKSLTRPAIAGTSV